MAGAGRWSLIMSQVTNPELKLQPGGEIRETQGRITETDFKHLFGFVLSSAHVLTQLFGLITVGSKILYQIIIQISV